MASKSIDTSKLRDALRQGPPEVIGYGEQSQSAFAYGWNEAMRGLWEKFSDVLCDTPHVDTSEWSTQDLAAECEADWFVNIQETPEGVRHLRVKAYSEQSACLAAEELFPDAVVISAVLAEQDERYNYLRCQSCGGRWQSIDFNCALHQLVCANPVRGEVVV